MADLNDYQNLQRFSGVPVSTDVLLALFEDYALPHQKIAQLVRQGLLVRLRRGLYSVMPEEDERKTSLMMIANHLYGPSYVSLETALSLYGLIPEHVFSVYSMTLRRSRSFSTALGSFAYVHCPRGYYSTGITMREEENGAVLIARPEKALADLIVSRKDLRIQSAGALRSFLEDDMRIDRDDLARLDQALIRQIADLGYKKRELGLLSEVVEHG